MKKLILLFTILLGMAAPLPAVMIDFESFADSVVNRPGLTLTDQYANLGVLFGGNILDFRPTYAMSGRNVLKPTGGGWGFAGSYNLLFTAPVNYLGAWGLDVGQAGFCISAFDEDQNLIAYTQVFGKGIGAGQKFFLELTSQKYIHSAIISQVIPEAGWDGYMIDDLTFHEIPVPEPSTLLLVGAGLMGIAAWRRKKPR